MTLLENTQQLDETDQRVSELVEELLASFPPADTHPRDFLGAQFDAGLAWVHFPEGSGGLGLSPKLQRMINEQSVDHAGTPRKVGGC